MAKGARLRLNLRSARPHLRLHRGQTTVCIGASGTDHGLFSIHRATLKQPAMDWFERIARHLPIFRLVKAVY